MPSEIRRILDWVLTLALAVLLSLVIRSYVAEARWIPSTSMLPTLKIGDRLIIDKFSFKFNGVSRGSMGSKGTSDCVKCPLPK